MCTRFFELSLHEDVGKQAVETQSADHFGRVISRPGCGKKESIRKETKHFFFDYTKKHFYLFIFNFRLVSPSLWHHIIFGMMSLLYLTPESIMIRATQVMCTSHTPSCFYFGHMTLCVQVPKWSTPSVLRSVAVILVYASMY